MEGARPDTRVVGRSDGWPLEPQHRSPRPTLGSCGAPIYERLAFFWHDHFACGQHKVQDIEAMWDQLRLFRRMALGNFATLLKAVAIHPAMLVALDNQHNTVRNPQENFAREVMELYTCGVGHFSEADVVSMAAAWTGHNTIGFSLGDTHWNSTYAYRDDDHDNSEKTLFGITARWNGIAQHPRERDAIDELVFGSRQHATAERITTLMFRFFANLEPDQTTISELANVFKQSGMEISALVRAILLHDDFWNQSSRWALVKNPLDFVVSVIRRTGLPASSLELRHPRCRWAWCRSIHRVSRAGAKAKRGFQRLRLGGEGHLPSTSMGGWNSSNNFLACNT